MMMSEPPASLPTTPEEVKAYFEDTASLRVPVDHVTYNQLRAAGSVAVQLLQPVAPSPLTRKTSFLVMDMCSQHCSTGLGASFSAVRPFITSSFAAFSTHA